jgi:hypothetical protein
MPSAPATAQHSGQAPHHDASHPRLLLATGIVKALFTTPPSQTTEVVVHGDEVDIKPAGARAETAETS